MTLIIEASPYFKAGSITADTLIIHGEMDQMVSYHQSENLYYAILENGGRSDLILLENANHILKPFVPDLSVELSSEEIAKATTCYMLDKLLLKHPEYVRKWINNNRMKLNHPNDKDARLDKKVCMGQDILEIKDCETEDSMYYRIYCQQNNKLDLLAEIPKTGRITCYEVDIAQINASGLLDSPSQEFLVTRVLTSGKESRTSQTFSDFRKYCD